MKRIRFTALELEAIEQALSLWEATADTEEDGDVSAEDARRLRDANGRCANVHDLLPEATCDRIRPWWRGPWGWLLEEAVLLPEPIPMRGQQGLWRIPRRDEGDETGPRISEAATWALEQWRKTRETR